MRRILRRVCIVFLALTVAFTIAPFIGDVTGELFGAKKVYADGDVSPPQIDTSTASVEVLGKEGKIAEAGDTVRLYIDITDESAFDTRLYFRKPITGGDGYPTSSGKRIEGTDTWYWDLEVTDATENGTWEVSYLNLEDNNNNYIWYHNQVTNPVSEPDEHYVNVDFSGFSFEVAGTHPDTTAPVIDLSTATVTPVDAVPGDTVVFSVKITDDTRVNEVNLWILWPNGHNDTWMDMSYNESTEKWEYTIPITEDTINGTWKIYMIRAYDDSGNYTDIDFEEDGGPYTFNVTGGNNETNPPIIDVSSIHVTLPEGNDSFASGDDMRMDVGITDETSVDYVGFYYIQPQTGREQLYLGTYDEQKGTWYCRIHLVNGSQTGVWKLSYIHAFDSYENEVKLYNSNISDEPGAVDLSAADFTVKRTIGRGDFVFPDNLVYNGGAFTPKPIATITIDGETEQLEEGTDYEITGYSDNINAGEAKIFIRGLNNYAGTITKEFIINPKAVKPKITLSKSYYFYKKGYDRKPSVKVYDGDKELAKTNYSVVWPADMRSTGKKMVTVTMTGNYSGTSTATYTIFKPTIKLSESSYVYNGKTRKPTIAVYNGDTKIGSANYRVNWPSNTISVGIKNVKITMTGKYYGSKAVSYKINPKGTTLLESSNYKVGKTYVTVKWNKQSTKMSSKRITGYQVMLATNSKFTKGKKTVTVSGYTKASKKVTGLKSGKKYYVKIRTYKVVTVDGKKVKLYSPWSKVKTVTTKK